MWQSVHTFLNYHKKWVVDIIGPEENKNKKKKKKKKSSGNSIKPRLTLHTIHINIIVLLCVEYYLKITKCIKHIFTKQNCVGLRMCVCLRLRVSSNSYVVIIINLKQIRY